ncbi:MAG TPA: hypothetical protein ENF92_01970 [Desulfobacteraceae bacterium]|nr:hypothetical protein [Desulfobacteraceae bacterium]
MLPGTPYSNKIIAHSPSGSSLLLASIPPQMRHSSITGMVMYFYCVQSLQPCEGHLPGWCGSLFLCLPNHRPYHGPLKCEQWGAPRSR